VLLGVDILTCLIDEYHVQVVNQPFGVYMYVMIDLDGDRTLRLLAVRMLDGRVQDKNLCVCVCNLFFFSSTVYVQSLSFSAFKSSTG
jgi:hypothetical protein